MRSFIRRASWRSPLIFIALLDLVTADGFVQCYYPDGSVPTDYLWIPCTPGAKNSACCAAGDICQANGLCYYGGDLGPGQELYRGTCTDRTFDDPSCNADICVNGFETTWVWTQECGSSSNPTWECGPIDSDGHEAANCTGSAATVAFDYITTTSSTSAARYTAPPSVDTAIYTVITTTLEAAITLDQPVMAGQEPTTFTTTWESTITEKINAGKATATGGAAATTEAGSAETGSSNSGSSSATESGTGGKNPKTAGKVVIGTGVLIAIIAIPIVLICLAVGLFICLKKHRSKRQDEPIRLNSANPDNSYPPPNGPVGADQVYPYEVPVNEAKPHAPQYKPVPGPKVDTYEIDDPNAVLREKYTQNQNQNQNYNQNQNQNYNQYQQPQQYQQYQQRQQGGDNAMGYYGGAKTEEQRAELSPVTPMRSPAPVYSQLDTNGFAPVELADTSTPAHTPAHTPIQNTGGFRFS